MREQKMSERIAKLRELLHYMNHSWDRTQNFEVLATPAAADTVLYRGFRFMKLVHKGRPELMPVIQQQIQDVTKLLDETRRREASMWFSSNRAAEQARRTQLEKLLEEARDNLALTLDRVSIRPPQALQHILNLTEAGYDAISTVTSTTDLLQVALRFAGFLQKQATSGNLTETPQRFIFAIQVPKGFPIVDTTALLSDFRRTHRMRFQESETLFLPYYGGKQLRFRFLWAAAAEADHEAFRLAAQLVLKYITENENRDGRPVTAEQRRRAVNFTLIMVEPQYVDIAPVAPEEPDEVQGARMVDREEEPQQSSACTIS